MTCWRVAVLTLFELKYNNRITNSYLAPFFFDCKEKNVSVSGVDGCVMWIVNQPTTNTPCTNNITENNNSQARSLLGAK